MVDPGMPRKAEARPSSASGAWFVTFEEWMHAVNVHMLPCVGRSRGTDGFRGGLHRRDLGASTMMSAQCSGRTAIVRTPRTIRQSDPEIYLLRLQTDGVGVCSFDDGTVRLQQPGEVTLTASSHPLSHSSDSDQDGLVSLVIPYRLIPLPPDRITRLTHPSALPTDTGVGAMLATMLAALPDRQDQMTTNAAIRVGGVIIDLLTTTLAEQVDDVRRVDPDRRDRVLLAKAEAFIDANLHLPELSLDTVASACAVSTRQLSRLFAGEGVSRRIRNRRLERIRRDLTEPVLDHLSIEHIGSRHGLVHAAHINRAFKAAYGVTPGEYRRSWRRSTNHPAPEVNMEH